MSNVPAFKYCLVCFLGRFIFLSSSRIVRSFSWAFIFLFLRCPFGLFDFFTAFSFSILLFFSYEALCLTFNFVFKCFLLFLVWCVFFFFFCYFFLLFIVRSFHILFFLSFSVSCFFFFPFFSTVCFLGIFCLCFVRSFPIVFFLSFFLWPSLSTFCLSFLSSAVFSSIKFKSNSVWNHVMPIWTDLQH